MDFGGPDPPLGYGPDPGDPPSDPKQRRRLERQVIVGFVLVVIIAWALLEGLEHLDRPSAPAPQSSSER